MGVRDLAKEAGIAANTVGRFENGSGAGPETLKVIQQALEKAGIVFFFHRTGETVQERGYKSETNPIAALQYALSAGYLQ